MTIDDVIKVLQFYSSNGHGDMPVKIFDFKRCEVREIWKIWQAGVEGAEETWLEFITHPKGEV